jgi:hypothetical protein
MDRPNISSSTIVAGNALVASEMLVEIEADAVVNG